MKKGLFALALGTFGLGMAEYIMMSILPDLASGFGVSIPEAGQLISLYALGVCFGAPVAAIALRNVRLKTTLLLLMAVYIAGNAMFALSSEFHMALAARFISGIPHGAFFGTGSIVASRLMPGKATTAVAMMVMGMTVANFVGVPLGNFIAGALEWNTMFFFNAFWGLATALGIWLLIPDMGALERSSIKGVFRFLKRPEPWLLIFATMTCNGGAFAMYSYVSPVMSHAGLHMAYMPLFMLLVGGSMCLGNILGGTLGDRLTPPRMAMITAVGMTLSLLLVYIGSASWICAGMAVLLVTGCLFAISSPMQLMLIEYSPGGEMMGGAMVQVAFNLGNAIGAFAGGIPISAGLAPGTSAIVGAAIASISIIALLLFRHRIGVN